MENINAYDSNGELIDLLVQWDKGIILYFNDNIFDDNYTIHLFTDDMDMAMVVESVLDDNGILSVKLPDDILTMGKAITGYICTRTEIEYRNSYKFKLPVRKKPKPSNYIYVDSNEYIFLEDKLDEINANVEITNENVNKTLESAKSAKDNADKAFGYMEQSEIYKNESESNKNESEKYAKELYVLYEKSNLTKDDIDEMIANLN